MKYMFLEFKFIKEDRNKILLSCIIFPLLGVMICLKGEAFRARLLTESMTNLFGTVNHSSVNWMYWLLFCFGYVVMFQTVWKRREKYFEYKVFILLQDTLLYFINRITIGFFFTLLYVLCAFLMVISFCIIFLAVRFNMHLSLIFMFVCISINLYLHAVFWMFLKVYTTNSLANVCIFTLFFAGVKIQAPFVPLHYGMIGHFRDHYTLSIVFFTELLFILLLAYGIIKKLKTADYF